MIKKCLLSLSLYKNLLKTISLSSLIIFLSAPFVFPDQVFLNPGNIITEPDWSEVFEVLHNLYTIDFEDQPSGTEIYNQYANRGVLFPFYPLVSTPTVNTSSGSKAITNAHPGEEFPGLIRVDFTTGQSSVAAYIGTGVSTNGIALKIYANAYDRAGQLVASLTPVNMGAGPTDINHFVQLSSASKNIWRVEFDVYPRYPFYLDDLFFSNIGPAPPDLGQGPSIKITSPTEAHHFWFDSFEYRDGNCGTFGGEIISQNRLKQVSVSVTGNNNSRTFDIGFGRIDNQTYSFGGFVNICSFLFEGENQVEVTAVDWEGHENSESITIGYYPIRNESRLLIITPSNFRDVLLPLASHKSLSGMPAHIVTLGAISRDPRFLDSRDLAEKIKKTIAYGYQHYGTRYVMLVGDSDQFPVRYCRHLPSETHQGYGEFYFPADLYYADLFKFVDGEAEYDNWDENGNGYIGEMSNDGASCDEYLIDQVSSLPEVAVGRVPASTKEDVVRYVKKVIDYENDYHPAWFYKMLLLTGGYPGDESTNNWIADNTMSNFQKTKYYRSDHFDPQRADLYENQITDYWNSGFGFVSYLGHGDRCGFNPYDICANVLDMHNENMLPVVFAAACYTAQFYTLEGKYLSRDGRAPPINQDTGKRGWPSPAPEPAAIQPPKYDADSCAEHLLTRKPQGAIAYIGCYTGSQSWGLTLGKKFFETYDTLASEQGGPVILGDMWKRALINYYYENVKDPVTQECLTIPYYRSSYWIPGTIYHHMRKYMLFGDPSLRLGGSPVTSQIQYLPVTYNLIIEWDVFQGGQQADRPVISGYSPQAGAIKVYEGSQMIGQFNVDGQFEVTLPSMTEGVHQLDIYLENLSGTAIDKKELNVIIDTTPPVIRLTSYTPFAVAGQIAIQGISENLAQIFLYEGDKLVASTVAQPEFANVSDEQPFILNVTKSLETGIHFFTIKAVDKAGNQSVFDQPIAIQVMDDYFCPSQVQWDTLFQGKYNMYEGQ